MPTRHSINKDREKGHAGTEGEEVVERGVSALGMSDWTAASKCAYPQTKPCLGIAQASRQPATNSFALRG
jgi:hypothetical protein